MDLPLLDALAAEAAAVAAEVPYYAVAVARARLDRARRRLLSRLAAAGGKEVEEGGGGRGREKPKLASPWPEARDAALLSLFCGGALSLWSTPRSPGAAWAAGHPASAPAALLAAAPLALCPVAERRDVGSGLLLATALQRACEGVVGGRRCFYFFSSFSSSSSRLLVAAWAPEPVDFAAEVVRRAFPASASGSAAGGRWRLPAGAWDIFGGEKPKEKNKKKSERKEKKKLSSSPFSDLSLDPAAVLSRDALYPNESSFPARCTFAALGLLERVAEGRR